MFVFLSQTYLLFVQVGRALLKLLIFGFHGFAQLLQDLQPSWSQLQSDMMSGRRTSRAVTVWPQKYDSPGSSTFILKISIAAIVPCDEERSEMLKGNYLANTKFPKWKP